MTEWNDVPLASLGRFASGKPIKPGLAGPYQAFGSNGVIGRSPESRHSSGVIVGRVGAYCGSIAVSREPFWASDNTIVIEPEVPTDLDFLYYLLQNANLNQHAGGSAQPLVTQGTLKSLVFSVPEPAHRARVGALLRSFDELIENNRRRAEVLEKMAWAIYREWFVGFRESARDRSALVNSAVSAVSEMTLGEICSGSGGVIRTGPFGSQLHQSDYTDDPYGIPVVMPKDMAGGRIELKSIARVDEVTAGRLSQHLLEAVGWVVAAAVLVVARTERAARATPCRSGAIHRWSSELGRLPVIPWGRLRPDRTTRGRADVARGWLDNARSPEHPFANLTGNCQIQTFSGIGPEDAAA